MKLRNFIHLLKEITKNSLKNEELINELLFRKDCVYEKIKD